MIIHDLSYSLISIEEPREKDENYIFDIKYDGNFMDVTVAYEVYFNKIEKDVLYLSIKSKSDLVELHKIYTSILSFVFENQSEWFENHFTIEELASMFSEFLKPNYKDNCIDIVCSSFDEDKVSSVEHGLIPVFRFESIIFNGKMFNVHIELVELEEVNLHTQSSTIETTGVSEPQTENNDQSNNVENDEVEENNNEVLSETDMNHIVESIDNQNDNVENEEVQEVDLDEDSMDEVNMKINDDDFYILYKLIQGKIYQNMSNDLRKVMLNKNIKNIDDIDLNELLFDITDFSDDEVSESGLNDDDEDFENNYSNMVS